MNNLEFKNKLPSKDGWIHVQMADFCWDESFEKRLFGGALPALPAVYVLRFASERLYVGTTGNLNRGLKIRRVLRMTIFAFEYVTDLKYRVCGEKEAPRIEAQLVRRFRPEMNERLRR